MALPWIVPRLRRCRTNVEEIDPFYDRWQQMLGTAVIEGGPLAHDRTAAPDDIAPAVTPRPAVTHQLTRRMTILCDGAVPVSESDRTGADSVGRAGDADLPELWREVCRRRRDEGADATPPETWTP